MPLTRKKQDRIVGLDIAAASVAATEVTFNGSAALTGFGIAPLPPGVCHEGEVADPEALGGILKDLFKEHGLSRSVRLGVANQRIVVRSLQLPLIEDDTELETAIRFQAQEHIPMSLDQAVLDWQVVGRRRGENGEPGLVDVVVVAGRKDMLTRFVDGVKAAGLRPEGLDVSAFGLIRALVNPVPATPAPGQAGEFVPAALYCSLGDFTNLAIAQGSACLFTRIGSFGIEGIAQRLAERQQLSLEHARQWLLHVGLDMPMHEVEGEEDVVAATREVLDEGTNRLADEVRLSLEYYGARDNSLRVEEVVASGAGTTIPGLPERLEQQLGLPFRVGRPDALSHLDEQTAARLTLPYGLALSR
jgi:type IV pilus assembly protein PilM